MSESLLTYEEAAKIMHVSSRTIRRLVARKKLAVVALTKKTKRIRPSDLERAIEKLTSKAIV